VGDRHLKIYESRDNLAVSSSTLLKLTLAGGR
jgi:hypothetical protein